jgi:hypothetical protein
VRFRRRGDRLVWELPVALATPVPDEVRDVTAALASAKGDLLAKHRATSGSWFVAGDSRVELEELGDDAVALRVHTEAVVTPADGAAGAPLARGYWDLSLRIATCGWAPEARLAAADLPLPGTVVDRTGRRATAYATVMGNLSVAVDRDPPSPAPAAPAPAAEPVATPVRGRRRAVLSRLARLAPRRRG